MIGAGRATRRYRWFHVSVRGGASSRCALSNIVRIGVSHKLWSAARPAIAATVNGLTATPAQTTMRLGKTERKSQARSRPERHRATRVVGAAPRRAKRSGCGDEGEEVDDGIEKERWSRRLLASA
jgi:hypothetical protein